MKDRIIDYLRTQGKPTAPEAVIAAFADEHDEAAKAVSDMLAEGRLLLTRKKRIALPEQTGMIYGRIQGSARGYGFFIADGADDMFIPADSMHGAMHGDMVWARKTDITGRGGKPEAEIVMIACRALKSIVGTFESERGRGGYVIPDDTRIPFDAYIHELDTHGAKSQDKVVCLITRHPDGRRPMTGEITEVLGKKTDAGLDILSIIKRLELPVDFDRATLRQAKHLPSAVDAETAICREDMRALTTVTIDGADAKDLDDAISLTRLKSGWLLAVHIADVSAYVPEGSPLDREAYKRGTSVYFPDRVLPMFPTELSNGICSLGADTDKLTLSCVMELDGSGKVMSHRIAETVIRSNGRLTYDEVNAMFDGDEASAERLKDVAPMLSDMKELYSVLAEKRVKRGSLDFDGAEPDIKLDRKGRCIGVSKAVRGVAHRMIEEFMLLANETVAKHAHDMGIPLMYRVHESPDKDKLTELNSFLNTMGCGIKGIANVKPKALQAVLLKMRGTKEESVVSRVVLRSMKRARYAPECMGHFGLALEDYCHFTSPIRRYPDLVVHRIMKELIHGVMDKKRIAAYEERLTEMAKHCSDREQAAAEAERAADDLKRCEFMQQSVGKTFTGVISGVTGFGIFVELENTCEGLVRISTIEGDMFSFDEKNHRLLGRRSGRALRLGDAVRVRVDRVDMDIPRVEFTLAG